MDYAYPHKGAKIPIEVQDMIVTQFLSGIKKAQIARNIKKKYPQYNVWYRTIQRYTSHL